MNVRPFFIYGHTCVIISTCVCNLHSCSSQREQCTLYDYWTLNLLTSYFSDAEWCCITVKTVVGTGCRWPQTHKYFWENDGAFFCSDFPVIPHQWHIPPERLSELSNGLESWRHHQPKLIDLPVLTGHSTSSKQIMTSNEESFGDVKKHQLK